MKEPVRPIMRTNLTRTMLPPAQAALLAAAVSAVFTAPQAAVAQSAPPAGKIKVEEVVVEGEGSLEEERREEEHIYGHNTLRLSPETLEYDYSDCFPPWKSPLFGGFVGQSRRLAA